ncbi:response regulator [Paenibacillus sp. PAMC21692]|uniref:response regulator n=1 Tax=Paenibacillus sp. PAMC21692 TaxID=2762320 RepID=UPI00164D99B2|nr:response regulator [Paenibacillus sp. PAMC21692]QNK59190.1 response regulator [Paenibacillus sp. PAMC21692]
MYRVMVVEDEPPLIRDIRYEIERNSSLFRVTATAINGADALRKLEEETPDVLFTDIRMPVMDGLELIKAIRQKDPELPFVILSGYRDFDYAKEALKFQAYDYLLKPVSPDDVRKVLATLGAMLEGRKEQRKRALLLSALHGEQLRDESDGLFAGRSLGLLVALCGGASGAEASPADLESELATLTTPGTTVRVWSGKTSSEKIVIVDGDRDDDGEIAEREQLAKALQRLLEARSGTTVNVAIGAPVARLGDIAGSLGSLRDLLRRRAEHGVSKLILENETPDASEAGSPITILTNERLISLRSMVHLQQKSLFKAELSSLIGEWLSAQLPVPDFTALVKRTLHAVGKGYWRRDVDIDSVVDESMESVTPNEIWSDSLIERLEVALFVENSISRDSPEGVVSKLDDYLKANSHLNFDPKELASGIGLTAPYLSKLFKQYRGMPLIEYLAYLKIEKAKQLIRSDPELLAKEIGEMLKFTDPFYFSRLFKKFEGCSPSEYRKRLEKQ